MKQKVENFIVFYDKQTIEERRRIREEFLERSGITYPGWYAKLSRKTFTRLELSALGNICKRKFV